MENASKALIIAGAILISILLISIGILLVNAGQDVANSGAISMSSQSIQAFNSQFTEYEGIIKGTQLKALFNQARTNNTTDESHHVVILSDKYISNNSIIDTHNYEVILSYAKEDNATINSGTIPECNNICLGSKSIEFPGSGRIITEEGYVFVITVRTK